MDQRRAYSLLASKQTRRRSQSHHRKCIAVLLVIHVGACQLNLFWGSVTWEFALQVAIASLRGYSFEAPYYPNPQYSMIGRMDLDLPGIRNPKHSTLKWSEALCCQAKPLPPSKHLELQTPNHQLQMTRKSSSCPCACLRRASSGPCILEYRGGHTYTS